MTGPALQVRALGGRDVPAALDLCARHPATNVYVAARIGEFDLDLSRGSVLGYLPDGRLQALCLVAANIVPVECGPAAIEAFAEALHRRRATCSSLFGDAETVLQLWSRLRPSWGEPLEVRARQPLMVLPADRAVTVRPDPRVRRALLAEVDLVGPAAAAMFTEEIGYPPFSDRIGQLGYWSSVRGLIARGHTFVITESGQVVFKADVGSVGVGACQIQGVWVDPQLRGQGLAAPALAAVVELARRAVAPLVTLYVNDYNAPAVAAYRRVGFETVGSFATVLV